MQWFYADKGKAVGPVSEDEFQKLVATGTITPQTLVWHEGMKEWLKHEALSQQSTVLTDQASETPEIPAGGTGETSNRDLMAQARASLKGNWGLAIAACVLSQLIAAAFGIPYLSLLTLILLSGPLSVGLSFLFITMIRGRDLQFSMMFTGFNRFGTSLLALILTALLYTFWLIVIIVLPTMLLGALALLMKSVSMIGLAPLISMGFFIRFILSYAMTFFIIADSNEIGAWEAIKASKNIMIGVRWKFFCLNLRFIPWMLLIMAPFIAMGPMLFRLAMTTTLTSPAAILSAVGGVILYFAAALLWALLGSLWLTPYVWATVACFYNDIKGRANTNAG